jgi:REP element-mobilizing transposase RayT
MTDYRRYRVKGGSYFFTVNLLERKRTLLTEQIELGEQRRRMGRVDSRNPSQTKLRSV